MPNNIYLISAGVNYYISGGGSSQISYAGSATPWTVQTTTPYELAMNDVAGASYTPQAAVREEVYGGGPPFRDGETLIYDSYGNVTETLTIQCRATSHDNAVFLLQQLRKILNTALFSTPCILAFQPTGATNVVYFEIYGADVQETASFVNEEAGVVAAGQALVRAVVTWRRSPHGGLLSAGETLINAVTFNNTGTGSPDNVEAYAAGAGEMIYEGSPLNIKFTPGSGSPSRVLLSSILSRTYSIASAGSSTTSSATFQSLGAATSGISVASLLTNAALKARVLGRFSALSTNAELRLLYGIGANEQRYTRPVVPNLGIASIVDFGKLTVSPRLLASVSTGDTLGIQPQVRSTSGTAVAVTLTYLEILLYYDFCLVSGALDTVGSEYLYLDSYVEKTGYPALPRSPIRAWSYDGSNLLKGPLEIRGTPPRYFSGASLYAAWYSLLSAHSTAATAVVTAKHAPLYKTLRGGG